MNISPQLLRLYAVTDHAWASSDGHFFQQIRDAAAGGVRMFQLREKHAGAQRLDSLAQQFVSLCRELGVVSIINDSPDAALRCGADGVHVGQDDLDPARVRQLLGPDKIIGVSAHSVDEALRAQDGGADYLGVGAAFVTATKSNARPIGRDTIRAITSAVQIPVVAIGGISRDNILQLQNCGLSGAAVVSALFAQDDVRRAAQELLPLCLKIV